MDNSTIQLIMLAVTILVPVLGGMWYLKSSLEAKIDANREAITNVRVELAKLQGVLQGRAMARAGDAESAATAL